MGRRGPRAVLTFHHKGWLDYSDALVVLDPVVDRAYSPVVALSPDFGYRLYKKFMSTVHDLGAAGKRFSNLAPSQETSDVESAEPRPAPGGSAIFASPEQMRHDYLTAKAFRQEVRRQRRVKRKAERGGQPQSLHDIEFR